MSEDQQGKTKSHKKKSKDKELGNIQKEQSFSLEPSEKITKLDTSQWPLLLKVSKCFN